MNNILSNMNNDKKNTVLITEKIYLLIDSLSENRFLSRTDFLFLLDNISHNETPYLYKKAFEVKQIYYKNKVYLRGLIEITNYCIKGCKYCGINKYNNKVDRYRLSLEEIFNCCKDGYDLGYTTFVLQGGEDSFFTDDILGKLLTKIKGEIPKCRVTLSLGERTKESYLDLFNSGADRYLLRHETASLRLYKHLHPENMKLKNRKECLKNLKDIGYQNGAGFMVGSPTQTNDDLVDDLFFLKDLNPHMVGVGPYICHEDTKLKGNDSGSIDETLIMVALVRLILHKALIPATTALGSIAIDGREKALKAGANVLMNNIGPTYQKAKYEIYKNKACIKDNNQIQILKSSLIEDGHQLDMDTGDHFDLERKLDDDR